MNSQQFQIQEGSTLDLHCVGDVAVPVVNGWVLSRLIGSGKVTVGGIEALTGGKLQLHMEGAEVFFREIEVRPITEVQKDVNAD